jgi:hypothetical protein
MSTFNRTIVMTLCKRKKIKNKICAYGKCLQVLAANVSVRAACSHIYLEVKDKSWCVSINYTFFSHDISARTWAGKTRNFCHYFARNTAKYTILYRQALLEQNLYEQRIKLQIYCKAR